ncbi:unnamed protein product [Diamesa serratosioi]
MFYYHNSFVLWTLLVVCGTSNVFGASCLYEDKFYSTYTCNLTSVSFRNVEDNFLANDVHVPRYTDNDVLQVSAVHSRFDFIPNSIFFKFTNLERIYLYGVKPITIDNKTFKNCTSLKSIHMDFNMITKLPAKAFQACTNIERIRIVNNEISSIKKDTFKGLYKLIELRLTHNKITTIIAESFDVLPQLKILRLSHNKIKSIHPSAFQFMVLLRNLYLNDNICVNENFMFDLADPNTITSALSPFIRMCITNYEIENDL